MFHSYLKKLLIIFVAVMISGYSTSVQAADEKAFSIAYMAHFAPISQKTKHGDMEGILIDIVNEALCSRLGLAISHHGYPWARAQNYFRKGQYDAIITMPTAERAEYGVFGKEPVLLRTYSIYTQKNSPLIPVFKRIQSIEELKPYKRVDFIGNGWTAAHMEGKGYNINSVTTKEQIWKILDVGRADYVLENPYTVRPILKRLGIGADHFAEIPTTLPELNFHYVLIVGKTSPYTWVVPQFDAVIRQMKDDGTYKAILDKWYGRQD